MPKILHCEQCGAPLTERQGETGCVHCLLKAGMEPEQAEAVSSPADFGTRSYQHYEILLREDGSPWELGRGAMGVTYKAIDVNLQIHVALKVLNGRFSALPDAPARFLREAQAAAQLRHPNVASVFHFGVVNLLPGAESDARGDCFYAMEFVEGETLEESLRRHGPLSPSTAVELGLQVARALSAAEKCGLVHRDLKPSNIMILTSAGTNPQASDESWVQVIDFGLAQAANAEAEGAGENRSRFLGTPEFASPEQLQGRLLDIRSDVYSLGCTLWYALTGAVPFGSQPETGRELPLHELSKRDVPPPFVRLLQSMLAENPDDRPESGATLCEALKSCRPELAHDDLTPAARFREGRRKRSALPAFILAAVLIALAVYFLMPGASADDRSIAVLPFKNLSADSHDAFFAEGLEDDLVASLVKIHDLRVIGRKSAAGLSADEKRDLPAIGRALGVRHILQGSLRRTGNRVFLQVSLLDVRDGHVQWAERYDRTLENSVLLQGELAAAIVDALDATLTPKERKVLHEKPTTNADAYLLYLRGFKFESSPFFVISDYEAAQALYEQALALDRNFALAHARLSSTLGLLYRFRGPQQELKRDAFAEAREALRLQPDLGEAHLAMAYYYYRIERNFSQALPELEIARRLLPNDPEPASFIAYIQRREGKWRQAMAGLENVAARDPRNFTFAEELYSTATLLRDWPAVERFAQRLIHLASTLPQVRLEAAYRSVRAKGDLQPITKVFEEYTDFGDPEGDVTWVRWDAAMLARDFQKAHEAIGKFPHDTLPSVFAGPIPKSYFEGCISLAQGESAQALKEFEIARPQMEAESRAHPEDSLRHARLGLLYAYMGRKVDAIREGERAVQLQPASADAYDGSERLCNLALIHARVGDGDKAIAMITSLLKRPGCVSFYEASMSLAELRLRWQWDPLRNDSRFQKILASPEPVTIY